MFDFVYEGVVVVCGQAFLSPVAGPYWPAPHRVAGVAWYDVPVEVALDVAEKFIVHLVWAEGFGEGAGDV